MDFLSGYKTYIAAVGLISFGIFQSTQGQFEAGLSSFFQGLGMLGVRHAISKNAI